MFFDIAEATLAHAQILQRRSLKTAGAEDRFVPTIPQSGAPGESRAIRLEFNGVTARLRNKRDIRRATIAIEHPEILGWNQHGANFMLASEYLQRGREPYTDSPMWAATALIAEG